MLLEPGRTLGKYRIERPLGRGGMGAVFLAFDPTLERSVAIKVLQSPGEPEASQTRLIREARSACALNHPNICTIYEVGIDGDTPFMAMEYVDGQSVAELLHDGPFPLDDALRYGIEAADALAHAHDRGVIHRDLKAGNAIVSSSGRLKIIDFGLAQRVEAPSDTVTRTATARTDVAVGTPHAMSPEQLGGAKVDARTDVWALGILLHEMLSGTGPFHGGTVAELFASILREPPASLPLRIPVGLRDVVHRCLAKNPIHRYQRAADVRLILETFASDSQRRSGAFADAEVVSDGTTPPLLNATTSEVSFVGRERECAQMSQLWLHAKAGRRQLLLLGGEPGIGKTRVSQEFARRCADEGATVLLGRSDEEALVAYQPFVEALGWYVRVCPDVELRAQLDSIGGGTELVSLIPQLLRRIPELPPAPAMSPEGQRYRLFESVGGLLAAASKARPILLILDDLHWADKPTLLMLRHIVRSSGAAPLFIVGTYRDTELGRTHPLGEILADLRREEGVTRMSLRGLEETHVRALVAALAGPESPRQLENLVMKGTAGNPFFVAEMMRHLRETGALARDAASSGRVLEIGLPEGIKEVIGRRLSRVSDACNRVLSLAAVIGREFDLDVLEAVGDLRDDSLLDAMDEAVRAQLIAELPTAAGRFSFMHALIRETLYGELTAPRRVRVHRRVAETLERLSERRPNQPLADLAYHFTQAAPSGTFEQAIDYATRAGDRAADALAHEEAARFYDMALQSLEFKPAGPDLDARRLDLHTRRARAFGATAQWALQKTELEHALLYVPPDQDDRCSELLLELASALFLLLDTTATERLVTEALERAERAQNPLRAAEAIAWLARCRNADGDLDAAIEMDRAAIARAPGVVQTVASNIGALTLYWTGRMDEAVARAAPGAQAARNSHDAAFITYSLTHFAISLAGSGRYSEAAKVFEEVRQFGRKYGVVPLLARATSMAGGFHLSAFDFGGAEALQLEARDLARSVNFPPPVVSGGIDLLLVNARRHEPGRGEALLAETTADAANTAGWHQWLWELRLCQVRAELALARDEFDLAVSEATEGIRQSRARGRPKYETLGYVVRARALHALGRTHEAIADARLAVDIARGSSDPAPLLAALDVLLALDGDDALAAEAVTLRDRIHDALPDDVMRLRFSESETVQRLRRFAVPHKS